MRLDAIPTDAGDAGAGTGDGAAGAVLAAFATAAAAGHHVPVARTGSATAARALAPWLPMPMDATAIWQALDALEATGEIKRTSYTTACRHVRACFALASAADADLAADAVDARLAADALAAAHALPAADAADVPAAADAVAAADANESEALATLEAFADEHRIDWQAARTLLIPGDAAFASRQLAADVGDGAEHRCVAMWLRLLAARA